MRMVTQLLPTLSVPVASPVPDALQQLAALRSCVANTLVGACASLVPGAAVPWHLYGLKIAETQSALEPIVCHQRKPALPAAEIIIAFSRDSLLKGTLMAQRESALFMITPGKLSGLAVIFLLLAAFFAVLNGQKVKALRANAATPRAPVTAKVNAPTLGTTGAQQQGKTADTEDRAAKAEAALTQAEKEKADLKGKLDASQQEIVALRQRAAGMQTNSNPSAPVNPAPADNAQSADLQSQVDDLRHQLDSAEKEKALLAEKLQDAQQRPAQVKEASKPETRKRRETASVQRESSRSSRAGVHGTVLAYNQAYNFVVLNLGARNGVESNAEMLVLRDGTLIGKIRISSVEPATAIGDIISNSLARGVQVQPGDSVIYAGTSP
jgi:cell shape-determining protein MreC